VVPENIHTPIMEGIGNSGGVGGSNTQEILEGWGGQRPGNSGGEGVWTVDLISRCPSIQYGL